MSIRIDKTVTSGTFSLDGGTWDVENNVWVIGDDSECIVIDAPHNAAAIAQLVGERTVVANLLTHAHDDHIDAAAELGERVKSVTHLHAEDRMLWDRVYPDEAPGAELSDGQTFTVAGATLQVLHTPGHSPGSCCFYLPSEGVVFSGDTLFQGGPGATGRSFSSYETIVESIKNRLFVLPEDTVVHTGHGDDTTIGGEAKNLQE